MPTSIPPEERQKIINNNRSLRTIKHELENLAENGAIDDAAYDTIMSVLPAESSLNGPSAPARGAIALSTPSSVASSFSKLSVNNNTSTAPPPTMYNNPTPQSQSQSQSLSRPPALPGRRTPTPATPSRPEIARATALYRYTEQGDCNFEVSDTIAVYEYVNADWWMGKNLRTGQEGVFPVNYVQVQKSSAPPTGQNYYGNEKQTPYGGGAGGAYPYPPQQEQLAQPQSPYPYQNQYAPPHPGGNAYDSSVPPMAVADEPVQGGGPPNKGMEMGKKFGKKLGNAAIFGAGATIGSDLVNSIF